MPDRSLKAAARKPQPTEPPAEIVVRPPMRRRKELDYAGIAHLANAFPVWGLICCGLIWLAHRERSRFVVAQAQQALYFHGLLFLAIVIWMLVALFTKLVTYLAAPIGMALQVVNYGIIFAVLAAHVSICLFGAWRCFNGESFRYPLVGEWME